MKFLKIFPPELFDNLTILVSSDASYDEAFATQ